MALTSGRIEQLRAGAGPSKQEVVTLIDRLEAAERALAAYPMLHPNSAESEAELRREWEQSHAPVIEAAKRERY